MPAAASRSRALEGPTRTGRSIWAVQDPKLQIQMLHDRVMIKITDDGGDRRNVEVHGSTYLVIRERELHAVASERAEHGTGLHL
jgi:hypothetical protein